MRQASPAYLSRSGWNAFLPLRIPREQVPPERRWPSIVIGAGFTGLAAARRLAELEPGREVLLIEADTVGENASGRNSGFLSIHPNEPRANRHGSIDDAAQRQIRLYRAGRDTLKQLVQTHGIDCGWDEAGPRLLAAATPGGVARARAAGERNRRWGLAVDELDGADLADKLGTDYYRYAVHVEGHVLVQPAALVRGVADALPAGVTLLERTPVTGISGSGPFTLSTPRGTFTSDRLLVTNNVHARALGLLRDRMIAIYTYGGLTPALPPPELARLGSLPQWGVIPAHPMGTTVRRWSGGRLLVRNGDSLEREMDPEKVRSMLAVLYRRRFPHMAAYTFEHVWGGVTAITGNGGLYFGEPRRGLFCAAGCNGSGVVRGTINGMLLAELALGGQSPLLSDRLALEGPSWIPPEPIRTPAVLAKIALERRGAGLEL